MADWSLLDREWLPAPPPAPFDPYQYANYDPFYQEKPQQQQQQQCRAMMPPPAPPPAQLPQSYCSPPSPNLAVLLASQRRLHQPTSMQRPVPMSYLPPNPRGDNPREIRNKAEKQRRDKLNQSIAELAAMVPPVVSASRKIDKTGVLRLTAHYLRAHQYVFGDTAGNPSEFTTSSTNAVLSLLNGFLLTTTYKGLVVVVSQNVNDYLGYTELDLLGQNIFNLTHEDDRQMLKDQLMPKSQAFGPNGELLLPDVKDGREKVAEALASERRRFVVRLKKLGQRSEPPKYVTCYVEGSLRKSDRACRGYNRCCQIVRRSRARGENPCSSGNDVVFIGIVRPTAETFINESAMESYNMEYRTRHSIDGEIIQCEQRIALVTGYMTNEVNGVNAMNFIHRDEVRWVVVALREMYDHNRLCGESCYRLMTKNGQFIYMRTRGRLDVDHKSRAVTSFVCTNTMVDEEAGQHLIKMMKERFKLSDYDSDAPSHDEAKDTSVPVENPRQLEKVILHLVTNLPPLDKQASSKPPRLNLIPPKKERIVSAIEKIYTVIKSIPKSPSILELPEYQKFHEILPSHLYPSTDTNLNDAYPGTSQIEYEYLPEPEITEYKVLPTFNNNEESNKVFSEQESMTFLDPYVESDVPEHTGTKRAKHFDNDDQLLAKKKLVGFAEMNEETGLNSQSLEAFFDEAILNTQIESAIDSLEYTIDPSFPDLLISNEVQDILGKIEETEDLDL